MGIFDKIRARRDERRAAKKAGNRNWDNPTQSESKPAYKQKGFNAGEGTGLNPNKMKPYTPPETPVVKKKTETPVVKKKTTPVVKNTVPVVKKKSVFDQEDEMYQRGVDKNKKKTEEVKKPEEVTKTKATETKRPTDSRTSDQVAKGNERAIFNRTNKKNAKPGESFKYKDKNGVIRTLKKGGSTKKKGAHKEV